MGVIYMGGILALINNMHLNYHHNFSCSVRSLDALEVLTHDRIFFITVQIFGY